MNALKSLSNIFEHRLIRIPDYQRGYAWGESQLIDFWEDLVHLSADRVHYTGVLTLEPVSIENYSRWDSDLWLIESKGYKPFYVVDGQQRLTTSVILIQAILETNVKELNFQTLEEIRQKYVLHSVHTGVRKSYLFGYEKDNPSDEFLRTGIFCEESISNKDELTFYTRNLAKAKTFFKARLASLSNEQIANIYKKLTQKFKFNLYEIDDEIDVFVTFETMNNRGKSLSSLELLKNRLIYLSTLFDEPEDKLQLRSNINETWKIVYEFLGRNAEKPLSDEEFLKNHWIMYFKFTRQTADDYINYLLGEKFTARNITHPVNEAQKLTLKEVNDYVFSLKKSVKPWFYMHNPSYPLIGYDNEENIKCIDRLVRLGYGAFKPLILAAFCQNIPINEINSLLVAIERYIFVIFTLSRRRGHTGDSHFFNRARVYLTGEIATENLVAEINDWTNHYFSADRFLSYITENYELEGREGFYHWDGIRYFLYEYEQWLKIQGKQSCNKLSWEELKVRKKDHVTLEHIYPQTDTDPYWVKYFGSLDATQKFYLVHSLGNLLPLSRSKNSSLQNDSFDLKQNNNEGVGYYNGSASENEVNLEPNWTPKEIKNRGMKLLAFMEERWGIALGDQLFKEKLLHVVDTTEKCND